MTVAHIAGVPLEETLAMGGPALLAALGVAVSRLRALRPRRRPELGIAKRKTGSFARCAPAGARLRSETYANSRSQEESCRS